MKWFTFNIFLLRHWCYVRSRLWYIPGNPSVFMEWFTPNISAASYIMIAHCDIPGNVRVHGYRVILTLTFFCIISSGTGKINFANHPHADIMFYWVIFTTLCGAILETLKKKHKNSLNDLMKLSHTGLGTSTCTSGHLCICWRNGVQLYIPLVKKNDV